MTHIINSSALLANITEYSVGLPGWNPELRISQSLDSKLTYKLYMDQTFLLQMLNKHEIRYSMNKHVRLKLFKLYSSLKSDNWELVLHCSNDKPTQRPNGKCTPWPQHILSVFWDVHMCCPLDLLSQFVCSIMNVNKLVSLISIY